MCWRRRRATSQTQKDDVSGTHASAVTLAQLRLAILPAARQYRSAKQWGGREKWGEGPYNASSGVVLSVVVVEIRRQKKQARR